ncbi:hypothetical protein G9U53_26120 [Rhodococcus sp. D-46]|uniref:hypothetical protein n=1 Tax=Rhodococcus sp. D-46 TaxID=2716265 RepID=UPI0013F5F4C8|nr:hypothetical protein [Rhodococcus sp. D-46]
MPAFARSGSHRALRFDELAQFFRVERALWFLLWPVSLMIFVSDSESWFHLFGCGSTSGVHHICACTGMPSLPNSTPRQGTDVSISPPTWGVAPHYHRAVLREIAERDAAPKLLRALTSTGSTRRSSQRAAIFHNNTWANLRESAARPVTAK